MTTEPTKWYMANSSGESRLVVSVEVRGVDGEFVETDREVFGEPGRYRLETPGLDGETQE